MKREYMLSYQKGISLIGLKNIQNVMNCRGHFLKMIRGEVAERFKAHAWKVCVL